MALGHLCEHEIRPLQREGVLVEFATAGLGDSAGQELFSRNQVRFRAEGRWALAIPYPAAFTQVANL
jgi:hypothetical protein